MSANPLIKKSNNALGEDGFLQVQSVSKKFGSDTVVSDLNLSIRRQEFFALLGSSGCGKSTLLRIMAGLEAPTQGRILLDGQDITDVPAHERPVNMMFQSYSLFPHMDVARNIGFGLVQAGRGWRRVLEQARSLGVSCITDSQDERRFVYQGWLAWQPIDGLWSLDTSVSPFAWGVLERGLFGVRHRHGGLDWQRLQRLAESWGRWPVPKGYAGYFGATFHEHNLCPPESYSPLRRELDQLQHFLDHFGPRIQTAGSIALPTPPSPPPEQPVGRVPLLFQRLRRGANRLREPALRQVPYRVWGSRSGATLWWSTAVAAAWSNASAFWASPLMISLPKVSPSGVLPAAPRVF